MPYQTKKKKGKRKKSKKKTLRQTGKTKKKSSFINENCSPKGDEKLNYTCYTKKGLIKLRELWNLRHPDRMIKTSKPNQIWNELKNAMSDTCDRESCWLKHYSVKNDIDIEGSLFKNFAPKQPESWNKNPNEWLSSIEISQLMKQYESVHKDFNFIGPSPIDFDSHRYDGSCVWEELCTFNLKNQIKNKKTKIGIIFNLDKHTQNGSHWVCMFININKRKIYYFDSYGEKMPKEIKKFANKLILQSREMGKPFKLVINKKRFQYSDSECGMFCLYIIVELLKGTKISSLTKKNVYDKKMTKLRQKYFNINF